MSERGRRNMFEQFRKECGITARSILFLILCAVLAGMYFAQYRDDVKEDLVQAQKGILFEETRWGGTNNNLLVKPVPGMEGYGSTYAEVPEQVRRNMTYRLYRDIANNRYDTYRLRFFLTHKSLKFEDRQRMLAVFERITGMSYYELDADIYRMDLKKILDERNMSEKQAKEYLRQEYHKQLRNEFIPDRSVARLYEYENYMPVNENQTYQQFKKGIAEIRKIIGGRPVAYMNFSQYGAEPLTYEAALARYDTMIYKDKVSGAYARLFCDNMGLAAGIGPALIAWAATASVLRRRRQAVPEYFPVRAEAEPHWIRFSSVSFVSFLPIVVLAVAATAELSSGVRPLGLSIDYFAFFAYAFVWLLPAVIFAAAAGIFSAVLTNRPIGLVIPFAVWLWSAMPWSENGLTGIKYGANLILRHGVVGEYEVYHASLGGILMNRAAYTLIAFALIAVAWLIEKNETEEIHSVK